MRRCASASRSGRSSPLDTAFHSPAATADLSIRLRGRVNAPGLYLQSDSEIYARPVRLRAPALPGFLSPGFLQPLEGTFTARCPLPSPIPELIACLPAAAPLQDLSILRDQSAQPSSRRRSLPLRVARSSFAPRNAEIISYLAAPRIIVPDPLLPARLAVLRTSWNHSHHEPNRLLRQGKSRAQRHVSA